VRYTVASEVKATIRQILKTSGPLARRAIAGRLIRGETGGFKVDALSINGMLQEMLVKGNVHMYKFPSTGGGGRANAKGEHIYSLRPLTQPQREKLEELLRTKDAFFAARAKHFPTRGHLESCGEHYVMSLFAFSDSRFADTHSIEPQHKTPAGPADLYLRAQESWRPSFIVEVKNQVEPFNSGSEEFLKLIQKALGAKAYPIFAASFLTRSSRKLCSALGIFVLELNRQVIFTKKELGFGPIGPLRKLKRVLHPDLFDPISYERPFKNGLSKYMLTDLEQISNIRRLRTRMKQWDYNKTAVGSVLRTAPADWGGDDGVRARILAALRRKDLHEEAS
jgi:hypothetical protein